jgi:mRNA-degrading endonuclease RelE of RelBE toxin-antitoxin system
MTYEIFVPPKVRKKLSKLDKAVVSEINDKLLKLRENPSPYVSWLKHIRAWKLRVGDYRVILDIDSANKKVKVIGVDHRKKVYE